MSAMTAFAVALSGTALICCLLVKRPRNRRTGRASSHDSFGADGGSIPSDGSGHHHGGGDHSASGDSGSNDSGAGDSSGGGDGGGGGGDGGGGGSD
jgi:hypothetical protein